ncbi:MAG TPA: glycosyltransferase family A protein [Roseimicrobium sp.]|nr:glycosyltransferase family A protein [Roseimicrobium sp.]
MNTIGVVIIGRNEGARLERCLKSVVGRGFVVVYVDSGSTDDSVLMAKTLGAEVVELAAGKKFTAARARNAGFAALPADVEFVQFVDGDCEVDTNWIAKAVSELTAGQEIAAVCGRRRERFPEASIYNTLCDLEWDTPIGPAKACGGDAMFCASALAAVGGYNPELIAGEEPELCVRLRSAGWNIHRIDAEMTLHDADMHHFSQWWRRNLRNGHAFAEGAAMHGSGHDRHWVKDTRSNWFWGMLFPLIVFAVAWPTYGASLLLLGMYPLQAFRIYRYARSRGWGNASLFYAIFCVIGKFPQAIGQLLYKVRSLQGTETQLIEYKTVAANSKGDV